MTRSISSKGSAGSAQLRDADPVVLTREQRKRMDQDRLAGSNLSNEKRQAARFAKPPLKQCKSFKLGGT
jgi:hypothetical protein